MEDLVVEKTVTTTENGKKQIKKIKERKRRSFMRYIYDWVIKSLLIGSILALDFVLFADAANSNLFASNNLTTQALYIIIGIFSFAFIIQLIFSFSSLLQNIITATIIFAFTSMIIYQFALFDRDSFLYSFVNNCIGFDIKPYISEASYIIIGAIIGLIFFIYLLLCGKASLAYFTMTIITILAGTTAVKFFNRNHNTNEFQTVFADQIKEKHTTPQKYIHIMLPNMASTSYLTEINEDLNNPKLTQAINIKLGFYAKNDFTYYPNSYVWNEDPFQNITQTLDLSETETADTYTAPSFKSCCLFSFDQLNDTSVYLKKNKLFDTFKKANYRINVYQSRGVDMCFENGDKIANKCVDKQSIPSNLNKTNFSAYQKTKILLAQWFDSMGLWKNIGLLYEGLRLVSEPQNIPVVGTPYDKLYVINSFEALDIATQDILEGYKNSAYFIYLDLPSDMLVYDESCNLKSPDKWVALQNLPWVKDSNQIKKIEAYAEQNICLFGKLENFINKLNASGLENDTVVVVQGLSSSKGLRNMTMSNSVANFKNNNLTEMAIKDPKIKGFAINYNICNPAGILNQSVLKKGSCKELTGMNLNKGSIGEIKSNLNIKYTNDQLLEKFNFFVDWYNNWEAEKQPMTNYIKDLIPLEEASKAIEINEPEKAPQIIKPAPAPQPAKVEQETTSEAPAPVQQ